MVAVSRVAILLLALAVWLGPGMAARADTIRILTNNDYPPFNYVDEQGGLAGFDVDIARAVCVAMQAECEFVVIPTFDNLIPALLEGVGDAAVASMSITEDRKRRVAFTNHYYRTPMQFVATRGFDRPVTVEGLRGLRIGFEIGTTAEAYVLDRLAGAVVAVPSNRQEDSIRQLVAGGIDLMLSDSLGMWHFVKSAEGQGFEFVGTPIYVDEGIGIALRKEDTELMRRLNLALTRIRIDGTYDAINARYFPFSIY